MNNNGMKKRWISLYVENQVGVLSKISGLFSGKSYNHGYGQGGRKTRSKAV